MISVWRGAQLCYTTAAYSKLSGLLLGRPTPLRSTANHTNLVCLLQARLATLRVVLNQPPSKSHACIQGARGIAKMSRKRPRTNSTPTTAVDGGTTSRPGSSTGEPPAVRRSTRNKAPAVPPVVPLQDVNQDEPQHQTRFTRPNPELLDAVAELAAFDSELLARTKAQHKHARESKLQILPEHDSPLTSLEPDGSLPGKALRVTRRIGLNDDGVLHLMSGMGKCVSVKLPEKLTPWVGRLGYVSFKGCGYD